MTRRSRSVHGARLWGAVFLVGALGVAFEALGQRGSDPSDYQDAATAQDAAKGVEYRGTQAPALPKFDEDNGRGRRVVVIPIQGTIDMGLAPFVKRALAEAEGAALVVFDVDTFGGRVDAAVQIRDAILGLKVPSVAFVNRRAISAGALISLACDHIVFTSGGSMGAATPIQMSGGEAKAVGEKMVSYMRSEMRATAEAKGRDGLLAEAMVDADIVVPGVSERGKLLTVTTDLAERIGLATARYETLPELIAAAGLASAEIVRPTTNWAERVARFLTDPTVSGLLMSLGMLGLLIEFYSPGFGFAGAVGVLCLATFFAGHMIVDLAGWEEVLLFVAGLACLGIEVFVTPGFGVIGVIGLGLVGLALVMAMLGLPMGTAWNTGLFAGVLGTVMLSVGLAAVLSLVALRYLPSTGVGRRLVLSTTLGKAGPDNQSGADFHSAPNEWADLLGKHGVAATDLRLAGKAYFDDVLFDVVSQSRYIDKGTPIRVVEVEGLRVVVVTAPPPAAKPSIES